VRQNSTLRLDNLMPYRWFTKGFDTKDLQEAQALLEEWSH